MRSSDLLSPKRPIVWLITAGILKLLAYATLRLVFEWEYRQASAANRDLDIVLPPAAVFTAGACTALSYLALCVAIVLTAITAVSYAQKWMRRQPTHRL